MSDRRVHNGSGNYPAADPLVRFWRHVDLTSGLCWTWTGSTDGAGYGVFALGDGRRVRAHRYIYEQLVRPIPDGLEIDHLCRVRNCVRPDHLEAVTHRENLRRAVRPRNTPKPPTVRECPAGDKIDVQVWRRRSGCPSCQRRPVQSGKETS